MLKRQFFISTQEVDGVVALLRGFRPMESLLEGEEGDEFWEAVGGKGEVAASDEAPLLLAPPSAPPRLFQCLFEGGVMDVHEVFDYCQENLDHRFVYVLDVGAALFAWVGAETIDEDRWVHL
jgi:hypothetical protein